MREDIAPLVLVMPFVLIYSKHMEHCSRPLLYFFLLWIFSQGRIPPNQAMETNLPLQNGLSPAIGARTQKPLKLSKLDFELLTSYYRDAITFLSQLRWYKFANFTTPNGCPILSI